MKWLYVIALRLLLSASLSPQPPTDVYPALQVDAWTTHTFNTQLNAHNMFEFDVEPSVVDESSAILTKLADISSALMKKEAEVRTNVQTVGVSGFSFFMYTGPRAASKSMFVSSNNIGTLKFFESIFERLGIPQRFSKVIDHTASVQLYNAFLVVRPECQKLNPLSDFPLSVGANAFTVFTPLKDYSPAFGLQMGYEDDASSWRTYNYRKGKAIAFGGGLNHSTQPGKAREMQAYLAFQFGSDKASHWEKIRSSVDNLYPTRISMTANGILQYTTLGEELEASIEKGWEEGQKIVPVEGLASKKQTRGETQSKAVEAIEKNIREQAAASVAAKAPDDFYNSVEDGLEVAAKAPDDFYNSVESGSEEL